MKEGIPVLKNLKRTFIHVALGVTLLLCSTMSFAAAPFLPTNYDESYRGQFHFSQQSGWMNDINGLWYYNGTYYMTYQTTPNQSTFDFAKTSIAMATSPDMMRWTQKAVIAEPTPTEGTPMSGSVVIDTNNTSGLKTGSNPVFVAMYTSAFTGQCLLYSNDLGNTWTRYSGNPVIADGGTNPRDPHVLWYAPTGKWVMVLYREGGYTEIYNSTNLKNWTLTNTVSEFGHECPDFFELPVDGNQNNKKWVMWAGDSGYLIGSFNGSVYTREAGWFLLDKNDAKYFYAAQTFNVASLPSSRVVQIGWQGGWGASTVPEVNSIWNQNATFPTQLSLKTTAEGIRLCANPIPEISNIWSSTQTFGTQTLTSSSNPLSGISSKCYDLTAEFNLANATASQIKFLLANKTVTYDITNHTLNGKTLNPINNVIKIRILGDWSQYEMFGNDGVFYWSERFAFDPYNSTLGLKVNGNVTLNSMSFHNISRTWPGTAVSIYTKYEAESGSVGGGAINAAYDSASGGIQWGNLDNVGAYGQITVNVPTAGVYELVQSYSNGMSDTRYKSLYVNGTKISQIAYPVTGSWSNYGKIKSSVSLNAGNNTIKIQRDSADNTATDFDYFLISKGRKIEAESGTVGGGATKSAYASASGGYQIGMMDNVGAYFQVTANTATAGTKTITIIYSNGMSDTRYKSLYVNGAKIRQLSFPVTGGWSNYASLNTNVTLNAGNNTIKIQRDSTDNTATDFDYILVP